MEKGPDGQWMHVMYSLDKWDGRTSVMVGQTLGRTNVDWENISETNAGCKKVAPKITFMLNMNNGRGGKGCFFST